jgi:hypothetical protein
VTWIHGAADCGHSPDPPIQVHRFDQDTVVLRVSTILAEWLRDRGAAAIDLLVAHTHSHGDHVFRDRQFVGRPRTTVVRPTVSAVQSHFGLPWPDGQADLDLGGGA